VREVCHLVLLPSSIFERLSARCQRLEITTSDYHQPHQPESSSAFTPFTFNVRDIFLEIFMVFIKALVV